MLAGIVTLVWNTITSPLRTVAGLSRSSGWKLYRALRNFLLGGPWGPLELKEADLVGTSIGTLEDGNAFVDFGVNDNFGRLPTPQHPNAHGRFLSAVCIYTFFDSDTAAYLRSVEHPRLVAEEGLCP